VMHRTVRAGLKEVFWRQHGKHSSDSEARGGGQGPSNVGCSDALDYPRARAPTDVDHCGASKVYTKRLPAAGASGWSGFSDFEVSSCTCRDFGDFGSMFEPLSARGFNYHEFMLAFNVCESTGIFLSCENMKMLPAAEWFDVEMAIDSRPDFFASFKPETIEAVQLVAMAVNRWNFMKVCMTSGQDWMTCTLSYSLFLLAVIHDTVDLTRPRLRMLEAGCGSGYLMALWAEMTGPGAEICGLELDPDMVHIARRELCDSKDTFSEGWANKRTKIQVARGDLQHMLAGSPSTVASESSLEELEPLPSMYFDVIVLGVAVLSVPERVVECLSEGGVLVVPAQVEVSPVVYDEGATRKRSHLQVWRKEGSAIRRLRNVACDDVGDGLQVNVITCSVWQEECACTARSMETPVLMLPAVV